MEPLNVIYIILGVITVGMIVPITRKHLVNNCGALLFVAKSFAQYGYERGEKINQREKDKEIENLLIENIDNITIEIIAEYSDYEKMSEIMKKRIFGLVRSGIHPRELAILLDRLGLLIPAAKATIRQTTLSGILRKKLIHDANPTDFASWGRLHELYRNEKNSVDELQAYLTDGTKAIPIWDMKELLKKKKKIINEKPLSIVSDTSSTLQKKEAVGG